VKYDETNLAQHYDAARRLPEATVQVWLDAITSTVPEKDVRAILDVGCGTGRFSAALADAFGADVIGIDPSRTMLAAARDRVKHPSVRFLEGDAEHLPVADGSACLLFLSMVYHHIPNLTEAVREFRRALRAGGFVCIRNSTRNHLDRFPYLKYFPSALECNRKRIPAQHEVIDALRGQGFSLLKHAVIEQEFAASSEDYYDKISRRGLSDLAMLPDAEFEAGIQGMKQWASNNRESGPVVEPVDFFVFKKAEPSAAADRGRI
jgi:ubiquinone/menaquinone biosynthesis C-methylase UbiE